MKIKSVQTVYQSRYFRVQRKVIERGGKTFTKEFIEREPVVLIIPYTAKNEIYVESQYRDALERTCIEIVAGHLDLGETPLDGAKRELLEETGLRAEKWKMLAEWDLSVNMQAKMSIFAATDLTQGEQKLDDDEELEVLKLPLETVLKKISSGEISAANHIAALLVFDRMRKEGEL